MKASATAPSNIAFIKYWGKKDEQLKLPENGSISMNLSNLLTTTTVEFNKSFSCDEVVLNGQVHTKDARRIISHLDMIRNIAGTNMHAKVASVNNFPVSTGLSSSASGFAALTLASINALKLKLSEQEMTILARKGSGSACRSIPDGFVEWVAGKDNDSSFAYSLYPDDYWNIRDIVVIVSTEKKTVGSTEGQKSAITSPFYAQRLSLITDKLNRCKEYIKQRNFRLFGELIEQEALEMHAVMLTSVPPLIYWLPETVLLMKKIQFWREYENIACYFTINTGQDIHIICEADTVSSIEKKLKKITSIKKIIINKPSSGAFVTNKHLF